MKRVFFLLSNLLCNVFLYAMDIPHLEVQTYAYSVQGKKRDHCEDTYIVKKIKHNNNKYLCTGIFDGHSGDAVATLAQEKFFNFFEQKLQDSNAVEECLRYACAQCEELAKAKEYENSGSTVLASCFDVSNNHLSILWLGDSEAYAYNNLGNFVITSDHNCLNSKECKRVQNAGGKISDGKLNNMIAVTRSLGDAFVKTRIPQLIAEPECTWMSYSSDGALHVNGFSIEASDGFWNVMPTRDNEELNNDAIHNILWDAVNLSHEKFYENYPQNSYDIYESDLVSDEEEEHEINIAQRLSYIAVDYFGSTDDTTVIVKLFGSNIFESASSDEDESCESRKNLIFEDPAKVNELITKLEKLNFDQQNENNLQQQKQDEQKNQESPKLVPSIHKNYKYFFGGMMGIVLVVLFLHYYYKQLNKKIIKI